MTVPRFRDGSSPRIDLCTPIPFFGTTEVALYVSSIYNRCTWEIKGKRSLHAYLLHVMVWINFTVCTGFPRYKYVASLYTCTNKSIHHCLLHVTMLINLTIKCRWTPMESSLSGLHSPAPSFVHSHSSVPHWLLPTGKTLTCVGVETFSTDRHPMLPWYNEFETNFRTYFLLLTTSLLPGFSLQPGRGYLDVFRAFVWYVCVCVYTN